LAESGKSSGRKGEGEGRSNVANCKDGSSVDGKSNKPLDMDVIENIRCFS
jgi:hypothetical protein